MLPKPVIVHPADIGDGVGGTVVFVALVLIAIPLVVVDVGQDVDEFLLRVGDVPEQFIVEPEDSGPVLVGISLVIHSDVVGQPLLNGPQLLQHVGVDGPPDGFCYGRPWIDLDGGELHQCQEQQEQPPAACEGFS